MRALLASRSLGGFMHGGTDVGVVTAWESLCNLRESAAPTLRESESHRPHRSHPHRSPKSVPPLAPISEDAEERGSNNSIVGVVDDDAARKASLDNNTLMMTRVHALSALSREEVFCRCPHQQQSRSEQSL